MTDALLFREDEIASRPPEVDASHPLYLKPSEKTLRALQEGEERQADAQLRLRDILTD